MKSAIPNAITMGNLVMGCLALVYAPSDPTLSALLILAAAILDFFDGLVARLLHASSAMGGQLDSLADVVSFGVVPGYWSYLMLQSAGFSWAWIGFLIPVGAAYRLARFNLDPSQQNHFKGLPVPANGLFWISVYLPFMTSTTGESLRPFGILIYISVLTLLMVSTMPLLTNKIKGRQWKGQEAQWIMLIGAPLCFGLSYFLLESLYTAIQLAMGWYLVVSFAHYKKLRT
jgi:CDP-diacylglycerol--serine O-phosphatidyltransferase